MAAPDLSPLDAALAYAARGWPVFPCHSWSPAGCSCRDSTCDRPAKHPRTGNGLKAASVDVGIIRNWWAKWPDANVGIATGNGLVVLDVDPGRDGEESLHTLEAQHGPLPDTYRVTTGSGGAHYYFSGEAPCAVDKPARGLDIRGTGGYVIAPPSSHKSGGRYVVDVGGAEAPASLPAWVVPRPKATPTATADHYIEGARNKSLTSLAGTMRRKGMAEDAILAALLADNAARCRPPLDEREVKRIAASVARYAPAEVPGPPQNDWREQLEFKTKKNGEWNYVACLANVITILQQHEAWKGRLRYNAFAGRIELDGAAWCEVDTSYLREWLQRRANGFQIEPSKNDTYDAVDVVARRNAYHPVREYLGGLVWDGTPRLERLWSTYYGADDTEYTRGVARMWMISAVARVMRPGCQVDYMPVLEGLQRAGKSSSLRILAGEGMLLDSGMDLQNLKSAYELLQGKWIVESAELDSMGKADASRLKAFLTSPSDHYRASYARVAETHARQCVFIGTTNENQYLKDATGGERFWPVRCRQIDRQALARDRDQLWAEARTLFDSGAVWWPDEAFFALARGEQEERYQGDPWEEPIRAWLEQRTKIGVTTYEILTLGVSVEKARVTRADEMRVSAIVRRLGWRNERGRVGGERVRRWVLSRPVPTSVSEVGTEKVNDNNQWPNRPNRPDLIPPYVHAQDTQVIFPELSGNAREVGQVGTDNQSLQSKQVLSPSQPPANDFGEWLEDQGITPKEEKR